MFARRRDERGAVFPMAVLLMGATLTLASLVVDIGGDRVVRRDMQSVADVVALDLVRSLDGRTAGSYSGYNASGPSATLLASDKDAAVARQDGLIASPDSVTVRLAVADKDTGVFQHWAASGEIPNAVRVFASGSSAFRFLPSTPRAEGMQRSALAVIGPPIVCISAGATLADLTPNGTLDQFLGRLIGLDRLSLVSPSGVAALDAQIPLGDLATHLGVGTVDQIATADISGRAFLDAAADVLSNDGQIAGAELLHLIAAQVNGTTNIDIGTILNMATGSGSAADLKLDAFSIVQAIIQVSNKDSFVDLGVPVGVTGLASIVLKAKVIEAPRISCGPIGTRARSAQVQVSLTADVTALGGLVASVKINPLALTAGDGYGQITNITCVPGGSSTVDVTADTAVGRLKLNLAVKLILGLITIAVEAPDSAVKPDGAAIGNSASVPLTFTFPAGSTTLPAPQTAGTALGNLGLASITPIKVTPLGAIAGPLLASVLGLVDTVLNPLLNPILQSLGIRLGTVEIRPVTRPACNEPVLRD